MTWWHKIPRALINVYSFAVKEGIHCSLPKQTTLSIQLGLLPTLLIYVGGRTWCRWKYFVFLADIVSQKWKLGRGDLLECLLCSVPVSLNDSRPIDPQFFSSPTEKMCRQWFVCIAMICLYNIHHYGMRTVGCQNHTFFMLSVNKNKIYFVLWLRSNHLCKNCYQWITFFSLFQTKSILLISYSPVWRQSSMNGNVSRSTI